ncbi:MAG: hypothetical protein Q8N15_02495 [Bacillota bacterium]|nr:hypothetical protein [Bacillota bacterium]
MNAFWHDGEYYLLPPGVTDAAAYLDTADFSQPVRLERLIAENAYAPCFEQGMTETDEVTIDLDLAATVGIELLSRPELDRRIALAEAKCVGCRWRGGTEDHGHDHCPALDLSAVCPLKETGFDPGFLFYVAAFWRRVERVSEKLLSLCKKGRFTQAAKIVDKLRFSIPEVFIAFTTVRDRPVMMISGGGNDDLHLVSQYLAFACPLRFKEQFDVEDVFRKGVFHRLDAGKKDAMERRPPMVIAVPTFTDRPRFDLSVVVSAAEHDTAADDAFLYFCERLGEDRLMGAMNSIRFVDDSGFDLDFHEKVVDLEDSPHAPLSAEAYDALIEQSYDRDADKLGLVMPLCFDESFDITHEEPSGDLKDVKFVHTCFMELDECMLFGHGGTIDEVFHDGLRVGRLTVDIGLDRQDEFALMNKFGKLLEIGLHGAGGSVPYASLYGERRTHYHFLVMEKRIVRNAIRALSPLLMKYHATYTEIGPEGAVSTPCGYRLNLPESD